jgi:sugar transferase (PEP-CTERM/EpsH1 system associated)
MGEIIFLAHRIPYPPDRGDRIRSFHILRHLSQIAPVHLIGFVDDIDDKRIAKRLLPMLASLHVAVRRKPMWLAALQALVTSKPVSVTAFGSNKVAAMVERLIDERPIDAIFVYSGQMAQFVPEDMGGRRLVMDFVDVDSAKFADYGRAGGFGPMHWVHRREARLLGDFEDRVARVADMSLLVSDPEAQVLRTRTGLGRDRVRALDNGIDTAFFDPERFKHVPAEDPLIVFTGQMDYRPNVEAVEHFARRTFPAIRAKHPNAMFAIVGRNPTPSVKALAKVKNVMVTGEVADVRPWIAAADVVVAPLDIARGIQNKILEAMAMARPVVASPAAFEGIDATPDEHLLVATGYDMANAVSGLLMDRPRADRIGQAARQRMVARYSWEAQLAALDDMMGVIQD